jgi:2-polyprenyl-6-methoxyphenol hydroxylase-like FAD-dependent oxidoreductase
MRLPGSLETFVLIVGAGPVGLAMGTILRRHGVAVEIIERSDGPTTHSKAIGVHARTLESMHSLGLTEKLISAGNPMSAFRLVDRQRLIMRSGFRAIDSAYPFVLGLPQSQTERLLLEAFTALGGHVRWQTHLTAIESSGSVGENGQKAKACFRDASGNESICHADWIVGADGSRSSVREMVGIAFPGGDYGRAFVLGDVELDWAGPRHELQFHFSKGGYLLIVPMPEGLFRVIAQTDLSYADFQRRERPEATLEELQAIVDRNGPGGIRVHSPRWLTCAPFYFRTAERFRKGRVFLAGDAAHLFSPLGAQGLNAGFQDAFNLGWKLGFVGRGFASETVLDSYEDERRPIVDLLAKVTAKTTRFITTTSPLLRLARRHATAFMDKTPLVQKRLPQLLAGIMQKYAPDGILCGPSAVGLVAAGARVPHAFIVAGAGYVPLASLLHGQKVTMLYLLRRATAEALQQIANQWSARLRAAEPYFQPVIVARETAADAAMSGIPVYEDRLGALFNGDMDIGDSACIAVRPDGFCAGSTHGLDGAALRRHLSEVLSAPVPRIAALLKEERYVA